MKTKKIIWVFMALAAFCLIGCFSFTPKKAAPVPVRFSFAEAGERAAPITFIQGNKSGVKLVDCNGISRPNPVEGTYWERDSLFPVEQPLDIRVYVYWNEDRFGERRRGIFKCPPLEAGKEYKLWFKGGLKGGSLILTYSNVSDINFMGKQSSDIVYEQIIPPPPK